MMRRTPLKAKKPWRPKRQPLKRKTRLKAISARQRGRNMKYGRIRKEFLKDKWSCEICKRRINPLRLTVHHKKGRAGEALFDTKFFLACCWPCHRHIEQEGRGEAYKNGLHLNRTAKDVS